MYLKEYSSVAVFRQSRFETEQCMDCYHHPCSSLEHEISHRAHCCWTAAPVLVLQGSLCYHIPFKQWEVSLFASPVLTYCSLLSGSASPTCAPRPLPDAVQEYSLPAFLGNICQYRFEQCCLSLSPCLSTTPVCGARSKMEQGTDLG